MIKVLQILTDLNVAGAQTVVMNYLRLFQNDKSIELKAIVLGSPQGSYYEKECEGLGIKIRYLHYKPIKNVPIISPFLNWLRLQKLVYLEIKRSNPQIVHTHSTPILQHVLIPVLLAHTKIRIHTLHSDPYVFKSTVVLWAKMAFRLFDFYPICVTESQAQKAVQRYGINRYSVIRNGIDINQFEHCNRANVRHELGIGENTFVIGCVGRLSRVKNHSFLLHIFSEYHEHNHDSLLMLVGEGDLRENLVRESKELGIINNVLFTGLRDDVKRMYCAMDLFMLTSFSESCSIVTIEAQCAGIRCVVSDNIPDSVIVTNRVNRLSLNAPIRKWLSAMQGELLPDPIVSDINDYSVVNAANDLKQLYLYLHDEKLN